MNASKEECRKAIQNLWIAAKAVDETISDPQERERIKRPLLRVEDFLEVSATRLPTEAAYERDRQRRKEKTVGANK